MQYRSLVYNLLPNLFWSITPALPRGAGGTRLPVGFPEVIPEVTFIAREVHAGDGIEPAAERARLNGFIQGAQRFHVLYGLNPILINSFDDILTRFQSASAPIERIRIVSHGNDAFIFLPVFTNGRWDLGMQSDLLRALQSSDERGLRFLITGDAASSPTLIDGVSLIVHGIRALSGAVLAPFGLQATGSPTGASQEYFALVNDLYQVPNGTIVVGTTLLSASQQATLTTSLNLIEAEVRRRVVGTTPPGGVVLTNAHLDALRGAVLGATPAQLGLMGAKRDLAATVVAHVQAALAAGPRVEADIRTAIRADSTPVLATDYLSGMVLGLQLFRPGVLNVGGAVLDEAAIRANADLEAFALTAIDLHHLKNVGVTIDGASPTAAQQTTIRQGLTAIADIISARIRAATPAITVAQLAALRDAIENRPLRESAITGGTQTLPREAFTDLAAANPAMQGGFRTRLDHFRGLMSAANASHVDVRGCLVGKTPGFLVDLRTFLGSAANQPTVTAPEWFQSFPAGFARGPLPAPTAFAAIDNLVANGDPTQNIDAADVDSNLTTWRGLIDFDPHFDFVAALFAAGASKRDFASLGWRAWRTAAAPNGIPILRMEAARVDDLDRLNLGDVVERLRLIFEIPTASAPNAAARGRLDQLQPQVAAFKATSDAIAAAGAPSQAQLDRFLAELSAIATAVTAIPGFPPPPAPLTPPAAPASLANIQGFATSIANHLDTILTNALDPFFVAIQGRVADANARIRYFYNIGLPLLIQNTTRPTSFRITTFGSAPTGGPLIALMASAFRSWMRIQWTGTAARATAMNATITAIPITSDTQRTAVSQVSMLSEDDPTTNPASDAGISPMQTFHDHIVTRP
jgi:hypothetical protein